MNRAVCPSYRTYVSDPYVWFGRHSQVVEENRLRNPEIILLGDSITHYWGGEPAHEIKRGERSYARLYGNRRTVNMGFGFDGTEHVLWRMQNGELDGISPRLAQVLIGTNNFSGCTDREIFEGVEAVCRTLCARLAKTRVLLLGILPRIDASERVRAINGMLRGLDGEMDGRILFSDPGREVLEDGDGKPKEGLFLDGLHPNESGYDALADRLEPLLDMLLKKGE